MIRQTVYTLLTTDPTLASQVPVGRWFERGSVVDTPPKPYVVLAHLGTDPRAGGRFAQLLGVYVHDDRGDFNNIDAILRAVRVRLEGAEQYAGPDGRLVSAVHQSTSDDLFDDGTATNTKNSVYRYVGVPNG